MTDGTQKGLFGAPKSLNPFRANKPTKDISWHNNRGDKFMHTSNYLKDSASQRKEMAQQPGVGFFKKHSMIRQANKDTKNANKLANKALFHWNKADKMNTKENGISRPPVSNGPFSTHMHSPDNSYRSGASGDEFGADDHVYKPTQDKLPKASTPPNTHQENPLPKAPKVPHPPTANSQTPKPYENHNHFEHLNESGGNQHHTDFESQENRQFKRAQQQTHTPHDAATEVTASDNTIGWEAIAALGNE